MFLKEFFFSNSTYLHSETTVEVFIAIYKKNIQHLKLNLLAQRLKKKGMEREIKSLQENKQRSEDEHTSQEETKVIPVIEEVLKVDKKLVETGRIHVRKEIDEEEKQIEIPLMNESYEVEKVKVKNQIFDQVPSIRHEGDVIVIPVIKEVAEIKIRYEVTEEIHLKKNKTITPHKEQVTLKKEKVIIQRETPKK